MAQLFGCPVGLSDHTLGVGAALASVALGACLVEKHFTLSRADGGVDSAFSIEPAELSVLAREMRSARQALGSVHYGPSVGEERSLQFRRSLYISKDVRAGETLTAENLAVVRPGYGLHPRYYDQLLGRAVRCDAEAGTAVTWGLISG